MVGQFNVIQYIIYELNINVTRFNENDFVYQKYNNSL